jgi:hypothetical protein
MCAVLAADLSHELHSCASRPALRPALCCAISSSVCSTCWATLVLTLDSTNVAVYAC